MNENESVGYELKMLENMIERRIMCESKKNGDCSLSFMQVKMLGYLYRHKEEPIYQKDIEKKFKIRRSTASGILQTMEKNDLIIRSGSTEDARSKKIALTERSLLMGNQIKEKTIEFESMLRQNLSKEEIEIFFKVIHTIKNNIIKQEEINNDKTN